MLGYISPKPEVSEETSLRAGYDLYKRLTMPALGLSVTPYDDTNLECCH